MLKLKKKFLFASLTILALAPIASLADGPNSSLFDLKIGLLDMKTGTAPVATIDPYASNAKALLKPYLDPSSPQHISACSEKVITGTKALLEGIKDREDYKQAVANIAAKCPAGTKIAKPTLVVGIWANYHDMQKHPNSTTVPPVYRGAPPVNQPILWEEVSFFAKLVDGKISTPLMSDKELPRFDQKIGDTDCSGVDSFAGLDAASIGQQIVDNLTNQATACEQKKTNQAISNDLLNQISQLRGEPSVPGIPGFPVDDKPNLLRSSDAADAAL